MGSILSIISIFVWGFIFGVGVTMYFFLFVVNSKDKSVCTTEEEALETKTLHRDVTAKRDQHLTGSSSSGKSSSSTQPVSEQNLNQLKELIEKLSVANDPLKAVTTEYNVFTYNYIAAANCLAPSEEADQELKLIITPENISNKEKALSDHLTHLKEHQKQLSTISAFYKDMNRTYFEFAKGLSVRIRGGSVVE
jgi:hypothetical protein